MDWQKCHELLLQGDYDNGWPDHSVIVSDNPQRGTYSASTYGKSVWQGDVEPITLLINAEFGDGDTIQFWRFVEAAKARVSKVVLRCNEDFRDLFHTVEVVGKEDQLPYFDKVIHMMALPKVLGIHKSEISGAAYLKPNPKFPPQTAIQCISVLRFFKVGICWSGNPFNTRDRFRSVPVESFDRLKIMPGLKFFTLNNVFDPPEDYINIKPLMREWNETAHLIQIMDLVITVDTAIAHLAGAMGKNVWMLTPDQMPDWRWGLSGEKTLWYDSMTLFRREQSWDKAFDKMEIAFRELFESLKAKESCGLAYASCEASTYSALQEPNF